jgi:hypothetical protein
MRKFLLIIAALVLTSGFAIGQSETSMSPILEEAIPVIETVEGEDLEIVRMEFDIIGETTKSTYRHLHEGWEYAIISFGDFRVKDIDVKVYKDVDGTWVEITKDEDIDPMAIVTVTPSYTAQYMIEIECYEFEPGYTVAHYGLIICHE